MLAGELPFDKQIHWMQIAVRPQEMIIQSRTFDLLKWLLPRTEKFPKPYRYTVVKRMGLCALAFQEHLILAQCRSGRQRRTQLLRCDEYLIQLRLYLRLAHEWRWLSDGQYQHVSKMVAEIGHLLGGWLKQIQP